MHFYVKPHNLERYLGPPECQDIDLFIAHQPCEGAPSRLMRRSLADLQAYSARQPFRSDKFHARSAPCATQPLLLLTHWQELLQTRPPIPRVANVHLPNLSTDARTDAALLAKWQCHESVYVQIRVLW
jgi:hypothetical protein